MKWFLFISFLALVLIASISSQACPPNQRYLECGTCDQICDREPRGCAAVCREPGCYCQRGYLRANPSNSSECVLPSNCPGYPLCSIQSFINTLTPSVLILGQLYLHFLG
ncbi:hypothetical protein AVEN_228051-1 [Araneus ventricosus]|uniref:TIL domain-containing protein n=1 Tax=Araneus ventricosus TaxID=182803 RepID=A0A4Y2MFN2_ARAVE|nr:hypothetical protein AVEN_228051-1 [Araneus ventricosus]